MTVQIQKHKTKDFDKLLDSLGPKISKSQSQVAFNKSRDLIPRDPKQVLTVMLGNQDKFNLVMEKLIEKLDKLDDQPKKKEVEVTTKT